MSISHENNNGQNLSQLRHLLSQYVLQRELFKDTSRLWARNLGRDDRVLSHWGKEARHPFLDEHFTHFMTRFVVDSFVDSMNRQCLQLNNSSSPSQQYPDYPVYFPLTDVFDASLPPGRGDKKLLRQVALALGLESSGRLLKRAMQFGTRIVNKHVAGTVEMTGELRLEDILNPQLMKQSHEKKL